MMASPKDEFHRLSQFQLSTLDELAALAQHTPPYLMQGLIYPGEITVFRHQPGAAWREFMYLLARSLACDVELGPFQTQGIVDTLLLVSNGLLPADAAYAAALQSYDADWTAADTRQHLHLYHRAQQQAESVLLDSAEGRNALLASLQLGTKVVIVDDMLRWFSDSKSPPHDKVRVELVLQDLNKRGIALVLFAAHGKAGDRFCQQHLAHRMHEVCLTPDTCAPAEIGGGLRLQRTHRGLHESLPRCIRWWWLVKMGEFHTGWQIPEPEDERTAKQVALAERQLLIRQYAAAGWRQREIAKCLGIHQSTVARTLGRGGKR